MYRDFSLVLICLMLPCVTCVSTTGPPFVFDMLVFMMLIPRTLALVCQTPPVPLTRDYLDTLQSTQCTTVIGDLVFGRKCKTVGICEGAVSTITGDVSTYNVQNVTGKLTLYANAGITTFSAPKLLTTGGDVVFTKTREDRTETDNTLLSSVSFPKLLNTGGHVDVQGNNALTSLILSALTSTGGDFWVTRNAKLGNVDARSLTTIARYAYFYENANPVYVITSNSKLMTELLEVFGEYIVTGAPTANVAAPSAAARTTSLSAAQPNSVMSSSALAVAAVLAVALCG